jgi:hypothetical protein
MGHKLPIGLPAQEKPLAPRDDEQAPIGQPVDAKGKRGRNVNDDLALALQIDGNNLLRTPVREPQTAIVPTRRTRDQSTGVALQTCEDSLVGRSRAMTGISRGAFF